MDSQRLLRAFVRGAVAAAVWGLLSALLTRALMRAVVLVTEGTPEFSWAGTAGIALVYTVALLPGAVALAYSDRRWPYLLFGGGVALLAFEAVAIGIQETAHATALVTWRWVGLVVVLVAMIGVYAAQIALVHRGARAGRRLTTAAQPSTYRSRSTTN
jgi:hypothetical protein